MRRAATHDEALFSTPSKALNSARNRTEAQPTVQVWLPESLRLLDPM